MGQHDRHRTWAGTADGHEVDAQAVDARPALRQVGQPAVESRPVARSSVIEQIAPEREPGAVLPAGFGRGIRPPGPGDPVTQIVEDVLVDSYPERLDTQHRQTLTPVSR